MKKRVRVQASYKAKSTHRRVSTIEARIAFQTRTTETIIFEKNCVSQNIFFKKKWKIGYRRLANHLANHLATS